MVMALPFVLQDSEDGKHEKLTRPAGFWPDFGRAWARHYCAGAMKLWSSAKLDPAEASTAMTCGRLRSSWVCSNGVARTGVAITAKDTAAIRRFMMSLFPMGWVVYCTGATVGSAGYRRCAFAPAQATNEIPEEIAGARKSSPPLHEPCGTVALWRSWGER